MTDTTGVPAGLGPAGAALWAAVVGGFVLDPAELAILAEACRVTDRLDRLGAELAAAPLTVPGSTGQPAAHPLFASVAAQAKTLEALVRALALPREGEEVGRRRSPSAVAAAKARWDGRGGVA